MSKEINIFKEVFKKLKTGQYVTCPGVFDLGYVQYVYPNTANIKDSDGKNHSSNIEELGNQALSKIEVIEDFNILEYSYEIVDKLETFDIMREPLKEYIKAMPYNYRWQITSDFKRYKLGYIDNVTAQVSLPYIDVNYVFNCYNTGKENKAYKELKLTYGYHKFFEDYGITASYDKITTLTLDKKDKRLDKITKLLTEKTFLSQKLRDIIKGMECSEDMKTYLLEGNFNMDMQFVNITPSKNIEFTPKNKTIIISGHGNFLVKNRQEMRPHRFFNKIFKGLEGANEYDIKCFVDNCLAATENYSIEYVDGKNIGEYYSDIDTDCWDTDSCMWGQNTAFFDIYADNGFKLGLIKRDEEIVGRFLVVRADDGFTYNDRVYYENHEVLAFYNSYTDSNDLIRRETTNGLTGFYQKSRGEFRQNVTLTLVKPITHYSYLPYADTLKFVGKKYMTLDNYSNHGVALESTDGEYKGMYSEWDDIDEQFIDEDDIVTIDEGENEGLKTHYRNCEQNEDGLYI